MSTPDHPLIHPPEERPMRLAEFQQLIRDRYHATDAARGVPGTFLWFSEEVGELAEAFGGCCGRLKSALCGDGANAAGHNCCCCCCCCCSCSC